MEDGYIEIANEFSVARVRKVYTRNGERLEISAPKQAQKILLDPLELESLTWQTPELFAELLTTPFGPEIEYE
jgi:DNA polymerase I-like protein with 3'-5' exonuclease and polymerase domains